MFSKLGTDIRMSVIYRNTHILPRRPVSERIRPEKLLNLILVQDLHDLKVYENVLYNSERIQPEKY